ncbi:MAG: hypothetical protein JF585_11540 [Burkholderiales bacterium]|nr:hypothetical protein [Burkholderiales bacterium]
MPATASIIPSSRLRRSPTSVCRKKKYAEAPSTTRYQRSMVSVGMKPPKIAVAPTRKYSHDTASMTGRCKPQ